MMHKILEVKRECEENCLTCIGIYIGQDQWALLGGEYAAAVGGDPEDNGAGGVFVYGMPIYVVTAATHWNAVAEPHKKAPPF